MVSGSLEEGTLCSGGLWESRICSVDLNLLLLLRGENFSLLSQVDPWPDLGNLLLKYVHKAQLLQGDLGQGVRGHPQEPGDHRQE